RRIRSGLSGRHRTRRPSSRKAPALAEHDLSTILSRSASTPSVPTRMAVTLDNKAVTDNRRPGAECQISRRQSPSGPYVVPGRFAARANDAEEVAMSSFVLIHGSWHTGHHWAPVAE